MLFKLGLNILKTKSLYREAENVARERRKKGEWGRGRIFRGKKFGYSFSLIGYMVLVTKKRGEQMLMRRKNFPF